MLYIFRNRQVCFFLDTHINIFVSVYTFFFVLKFRRGGGEYLFVCVCVCVCVMARGGCQCLISRTEMSKISEFSY